MRAIALLLAAAFVLPACSKPAPRTTVRDLNWACGASRCTSSFRLTNEGTDAEALLVLVRAYSGDSVADRRIAGEHKERLYLGPGQTKRCDVVVELRRPANRIRVVVQREAT